MATYSPYPSYQPYKPTNPFNTPSQNMGNYGATVPSNTNWASGTQAWDPKSLFYGNGNAPASGGSLMQSPGATQGVQSQGPTMGSFIKAPGPQMGSEFTPAPANQFQLTGNLADPNSKMGMDLTGPTMGDFMPDPSASQPDPNATDPNADQPFAPSAEYLRRNAMVAQGMDVPAIDGFNNQTGLPQDAQTTSATDQGGQTNGGNAPPNYQFTMADLMANMPNSQMPTMDQLQMDPGYQFRLNQGLNALQGSAAARGSLQSSGTMKDILDYSQGAASQEYQNAYNRFAQNQQFNANQIQDAWGRLNGDRSAGQTADMNAFNQYANQRNFDFTNMQDARNYGTDQYWKQADAYNNLMSGANKNSSALAGTGYEAAKGISDLVTSSATALAGLGLNDAQIKAMSQMAASGQHTDLIKSFLQLAGVGIAAFA